VFVSGWTKCHNTVWPCICKKDSKEFSMQQNIKIPQFVSFINSPGGRALRIAVGISVIAVGLQMRSKKGNWLAASGLIPLSAGALDLCLLGPLLGGFFRGDDMRRALHASQGYPQVGHGAASYFRA
jgi:hypothetical protein